MAFDVAAAKKAGYTDTEIAQFLATSEGFDVQKAKQAGYTDADIIGFLSERAKAKPARGPVQEAGRQLGLTVRAGAQGLAGLAGIVTDPITAGLNAVLPESMQMQPVRQAAGNLLDIAGVPRPANALERVVGQAAETVAGAAGGIGAARTLSTALTGTPATVAGQMAAMPGAQLSGAAGFGGAAQLAQEGGAGMAGQLGAGVLGGLVGAVAPGAVGSAAQRLRAPAAAQQAPQSVAPAVAPVAVPEAPPPIPQPIAQEQMLPTQELARTARAAAEGGLGAKRAADILAEQAAPSPEIVQAARRLGIEEYVQPDHVTTNEAYRQIVATIKSNPQSAVAIAEARDLPRVAERATKLIDELGGSADVSVTSQNLKNSMQREVDRMDGQAQKLYSEAERLIGRRMEVQAPNTFAIVDDLRSAMGGDAQMRNALPREAAKFLRPIMNDEPLTYGYLDLFRKNVGRAINQKSGVLKDLDEGQLKQFYSALITDQQNATRNIGPEAFYTFQAAQYAHRLKSGVLDDMVALFGRNLDRSIASAGEASLSGAMRAAGAGDASRITRFLQNVPEDMRQEVVASGLATVFRREATRGDFSFGEYTKWYEGLRRNRQAYTAVMSNLPLSARKQLEALYRVSNGVFLAGQRKIRTGALNTIKQEMMGADGLMENLYSLAKRSAVGVPAEAAASSIGLPGAGLAAGLASALTKGKPRSLEAIDELLVSPQFEKLLTAQGMAEQKAAARALASSPRFEAVMRATKQRMTLSERERWIIQSMQVPAASVQQDRQRVQAPAPATIQ
jgi:hypothetical protein